MQRTAFEALSMNVPTFNCKICFENLPLTERSTFMDCSVPDHACCRECTSHWMKGLISNGQVHSLLCGRRGNVACNAAARSEEVLMLTDAETFGKYERFMTMREDDTVRDCPKCGHLCKPELKAGGEIQAEMTCPVCSTEFCYYHSNAHAGRSCDEYERQMAKQEKEMRNAGVLSDSKQCPRCGVHTVKISGCNHMTCAERTCKCEWCWVCGQEIEGGINGVQAHYSTGTCRQFTEVESTPGCLSNFLWVATYPFRLFFMISAFLLFILTMLVSPVTCLFFFSCSIVSEDWGRHLCRSQRFLKALVLAPGLLLYGILVLAWFILLGACFGVFMMFISWLTFCCGDPCPDMIRADHTHALWVTTLPFTSLEPGRCILQWYLRKWTCFCCCCCGGGDLSDSDGSDDTSQDEEGLPEDSD